MSDIKVTKEQILKRWASSKATKQQMVEKMRRMLYEDYKSRMGEEPLKFNVL